MSQHQATDLVIDPFSTSGQQLAVILNRLHGAYNSMHSGAARPPYAVVGTVWLDNTTPPGKLMWYDGTIDKPLGSAFPGGNTGQALVKKSTADGDFEWKDTGAASGYVVTADTTAVVNGVYFVDTTGGPVTITLPANASGDFVEVTIIDVAGKFATNKCTVAGGANKVMGLSQDMDITSDNCSCTLIFSNATFGWRIKSMTPC